MALPNLGSLTGGGGLQASAASGPSRSGAAGVSTGTGNKTLNIGGNPNVTSGAFTPILIVGVVILGVWAWRKYG